MPHQGLPRPAATETDQGPGLSCFCITVLFCLIIFICMSEEIKEQTAAVRSGFVHLHNHTDFSLLDGAAQIPAYIGKCREYGMDAIAITDHGNMYGALKFYKACKAAGIKPIIGSEFYMNPADRNDQSPFSEGRNHNYHLILLAMNDRGYHHLMELTTLANTQGFYYKPRIDDEILASHSEDLICLSACLGGEILQNLLHDNYQEARRRAQWFKDLFKDRYYIELQDHGLEEQKRTNPLLIQLARELDIPLVCTNDIHYINRDDANAHDTLLCIGTNAKKTDEKRMRFPNDNFYFKSEAEMRELFSYIPEAIENTRVIADRCNLEVQFPGPLLPDYEIPEGFSNTGEYLTHLANEGCVRRYGQITDSLRKRLDYELDIILKMKFDGYFLIVRDYIYWAKTHDIPVGPGRGSGAGSLVAYCVDITDVDPIKYNLLFERFLNPERVSMPDFDIDFCFERRGEVIQYVTEHYGKDRVGQICTFGTLKAKAVVKDVARVLDIPYDESNQICKYIPDEPKMTIAKAIDQEPKLKEIIDRGGIYAELFDTARRLEGGARHTSLHAAGVVIGKTDLIDYVPISLDPKTRSIATQYTMDQIEECGLVKMDFLGLKTLTLIKHTVDLIHKKDPDFDISRIDEEDKATFDMLKRGESECVFQFESGGMQKVLRDAQPESIEDLVALNALYRPGPMQYIDRFVACKNGLQPIEYADPELEPVLKTTYGVIVYQEQVMQVAQIIAGYTLGQADILRRIMGKKKVEKLAEEKVKFVEGARKLGRDPKHAQEIFEMLEPFAQYGFNKSHAVAYSVVAYQTAYLKANYPSEFLAANLTNEMTNPDKFKDYLALADSMGIRILPPSINDSDMHFNVVGNDIVYGLAGIKNVGENITKLIVEEREKNGKYKSFMDFLSRQSDGIANSRVLEALIKAGCFDCLGEDRATLYANIDGAIAYDKGCRETTAYGQISLFGDEVDLGTYEFKPAQPWSQREMLDMERELIGRYVSGHPLDSYKEDIERCVWADISSPEELPLGRDLSLICQISSLRVIKTKRGTKMASMTLTNYQGSMEAVIFPKDYERYDEKLADDQIYGFVGRFEVRKDRGDMQFVISTICEPRELPSEAIRKIGLSMDSQLLADAQSGQYLEEVVTFLIAHAGSLPVSVFIDDRQKEYVRSAFSVDYYKGLKRDLMAFPIVRNVYLS